MTQNNGCFDAEYYRLRGNKRNKRLRVETDYNRVLNEYIQVKYGPIAEEFATFYDALKSKYPQKQYKGSKKFRVWVRREIKNYKENSVDVVVPEANSVDVAVPEANSVVVAVPNAMPKDVSEVVNLSGLIEDTIGAEVQVLPPLENIIANGGPHLSGLIEDTIGAEVQVPPPLENIIANGGPQQLEALDELIAGIIAEIEGEYDEGIDLSGSHELDVDPLYYDMEVEGLDDIELDMPINLLEAELNIELENF